jgi:hypothetical protein
MTMSWTAIACLAGCIAVSIVVIFMLAGGIMPGFAGSRLGQLVLAAIAAVIGILIGNFVYQRFFPGR